MLPSVEKRVERRSQVPDRRQGQDLQVPANRRSKSRRKNRKFQGSPPADAITIDVGDEDMVLYWAAELDVDADELKRVVRDAGPSVKAIRKHLGK
jgi:hypothetical protein